MRLNLPKPPSLGFRSKFKDWPFVPAVLLITAEGCPDFQLQAHPSMVWQIQTLTKQIFQLQTVKNEHGKASFICAASNSQL